MGVQVREKVKAENVGKRKIQVGLFVMIDCRQIHRDNHRAKW